MRAPALVLRLLLCALLAGAAACSRKDAPPATAQGAAQLFFDRIRRGELAQAFESAGFAFKEPQNLKFFSERVREYELQDSAIALAPLPGDPADAKTAKFNVEVTLKSGQKYALILTMERDQATWRVFSLREPRDPNTGIGKNRFSIVGAPAAMSYAAHLKVPDDATVRRLVHNSMILFSDAIQTGSFWEFYENASMTWQKELTEQKLANAFHSFIDLKINMNGIVDLEPKFDVPPEISADGLLVVTGHYASTPYAVHFTLRYIYWLDEELTKTGYELPEWKLLGLNCHLEKVE